MERNLKKTSVVICIILCLLSACGSKDKIPNTPEIAETQTEGNRIIAPDTIPEKPVVEEFRSVALNKKNTDRLCSEYGIETLFDCPYIKDGDMVDLAQIALYGRSAEVLMHEDAQGWELEKGSNVSFFVQSVSDDTSLDLCGGVIFDGNIIAEVKIMSVKDVQSVEIEETGTYYFYMMNCGDTDQVLSNLKITFDRAK